MPTAGEALTLFYPAALAAYGCTDPAHLNPGNGFEYAAEIVVDMEKIVQAPARHWPMLHSMLALGSVFGYVAKKPGAVLIAFRGTETTEEWLADFDAVPSKCETAHGSIHEGFWWVEQVVAASIEKSLACGSADFTDSIYITGHSLGAALALLVADNYSLLKPQVCTFAGPRVGLADFQISYNQHVPDTLRVVNRWDIVPHVPVPLVPDFLYEHVGQALVIDGGFTLDLKQAHSLPLAYLPGLRRAQEK